MYERGDAASAAFMFANGLLRDADNEEALNWLLMLYVEKIPKPGMEREVLKVLERQPDGFELFELIETRLAEQGAADKIDALWQMRERTGYLRERASAAVVPPPIEPAGEDGPLSTGRVPNETRKREATAMSDAVPARTNERGRGPSRDVPAVTAEEPNATEHHRADDWSDGSRGYDASEDWSAFDEVDANYRTEDAPPDRSFRRTTATTGVYSSLNAISEERARQDLRDYYAKRRKIQILIGLGLIAVLAGVLLFLFPGDESVPGDPSQSPTQESTAPGQPTLENGRAPIEPMAPADPTLNAEPREPASPPTGEAAP